MKVLLGFDHLITPKVLVFLYWLLMVLIIVGGVFLCLTGNSSQDSLALFSV